MKWPRIFRRRQEDLPYVCSDVTNCGWRGTNPRVEIPLHLYCPRCGEPVSFMPDVPVVMPSLVKYHRKVTS